MNAGSVDQCSGCDLALDNACLVLHISHTGMTLRAGEMTILEHFRKLAIVRHPLISHIPVFVYCSACLSVCGRSFIVHEPVDGGQHCAALSLLMYLGQPGVAEGNVTHSHMQGNFISLSDAGESVQGI